MLLADCTVADSREPNRLYVLDRFAHSTSYLMPRNPSWFTTCKERMHTNRTLHCILKFSQVAGQCKVAGSCHAWSNALRKKRT